jgi:flagellar basal body-associated protein FliL
MAALFIILMVVILAVGLLGTGFYMIGLDKKQARMEVERSLEMVPLLIHLPPLSDDTNVGGRDARDVVDETISKAQIVYNIISSTVQKDANSKKFGQYRNLQK